MTEEARDPKKGILRVVADGTLRGTNVEVWTGTEWLRLQYYSVEMKLEQRLHKVIITAPCNLDRA